VLAKEKTVGILLTFWWNLWKQRNRRIFYHVELSAPPLARVIIDAIGLQHLAVGQAADSVD
jgi:hypothetical protein